jgi:hypothetical protein
MGSSLPVGQIINILRKALFFSQEQFKSLPSQSFVLDLKILFLTMKKGLFQKVLRPRVKPLQNGLKGIYESN